MRRISKKYKRSRRTSKQDEFEEWEVQINSKKQKKKKEFKHVMILPRKKAYHFSEKAYIVACLTSCGGAEL